MTKIQQIKATLLYKQILADSFGGIMYNVANRNKYDAGKDTLLDMWHNMTPAERENADGIMTGAMNFLIGNN